MNVADRLGMGSWDGMTPIAAGLNRRGIRTALGKEWVEGLFIGAERAEGFERIYADLEARRDSPPKLQRKAFGEARDSADVATRQE